MSTPLCLDIDLMTPACVLWESGSTTHSLIDPDPRTRSLQLETHFDKTTSSASFAIHCPARLKGIDSHSHILGLIPPRAITSFTFKAYPNPPDEVRKKLNCCTVRLRFELSQPLHLVAPAAATEPVQPRKRLSAEVFHTLRSLATAMTFDIYVPDRELPHIKLNAIRAAVSQTLLKPFDPDLSNILASFYGGRGGKVVDLSLPENNVSLSPSDEPPAYDEIKPPPLLPEPLLLSPVAKPSRGNERKRPRQDESSSEEADSRLDLTWAMVVEMREEMHKLAERVEHLEKENKELRDELDAVRDGCEKAVDGVNADEVAILEMQDDLNDLTDRVDFLSKNGLDSDVEQSIIKKVTRHAVTSILEKNYKLSIEEE